MSYNHKALKQYKSVDVSSSIESASPHQLILMLFDGALTFLARAKGLMRQSDFEGKGEQINKASKILIHLKGALDHEQGGEVAGNLDALYDYALRRLVDANRENNDQIIDEVSELIVSVKNGWEQMPEDVK